MPYLLDTNVLGAYLLRRPGAVALIDPLVQQHEAETSILVFGEVTEYLRGFGNADQLQIQMRRLMVNIPPRPLTYAAVEKYADLRRLLRPLGLITTDSDFMRVPNLAFQLVTRAALR